ncbi:MAG: hypothetical protein ABS76_37360 [Pelagibacterium sp. SCN 64-44]|nr:MAG: hypothetical protein ABS76_37360 [Pelagibacterium sp. SCN 64-44]
MGTGSVDIAGAVRAAVRAGYSGPLGYEAFSAGTSNPQLNANLATWRTMWSDNDAAAQEALDRIVVELNAANASLYKLS